MAQKISIISEENNEKKIIILCKINDALVYSKNIFYKLSAITILN